MRPDPFYAADIDGDCIEVDITEDAHAKEAYGAFLTVVCGRRAGVFLDRLQAIQLRDYLCDALEPSA
jgi:hypothetical protein